MPHLDRNLWTLAGLEHVGACAFLEESLALHDDVFALRVVATEVDMDDYLSEEARHLDSVGR